VTFVCRRTKQNSSSILSDVVLTTLLNVILHQFSRGRRDPDRMVVKFTTTSAISAYHPCCCELESWSGRGVQHYVIKFVSNLRQVGGFLRVLRFPPPIKLTYHDKTEILLKLPLNAIKPKKPTNFPALVLWSIDERGSVLYMIILLIWCNSREHSL